jgi:Delta7-sterol 5-desaturase
MSEREATAAAPKPAPGGWHWRPALPLHHSALGQWPPRPLALLRDLLGFWWPPTGLTIWLALAIAMWFTVIPDMATCATLAWPWIAQVYVTNLVIMLVVVGGLHLHLLTFAGQGDEDRFTTRGMAKGDPRFAWKDQVLDNMTWSIASGVTLWTVFEVAYLWAYANGIVPGLTFDQDPVWFVLFFFVIPVWNDFHFYCIHRLLHWKPLYRMAHAVHHRNVDVGPWSGLSMHPVEHLLLFSNLAIHLVLPSHPIHVLFSLLFQAVDPAITHAGFATLRVRGRRLLDLGHFHHQLHHRYFECNYGSLLLPLDDWFGWSHDGTAEATAKMRKRQIAMR